MGPPPHKLWAPLQILPILEGDKRIEGQIAYLLGPQRPGTVPLAQVLSGYGFGRPGLGVNDPALNNFAHTNTVVFKGSQGVTHTLRFNLDKGGILGQWTVDMTSIGGTVMPIISSLYDTAGRCFQNALFYSDSHYPSPAFNNPTQGGDLQGDFDQPGVIKGRHSGSPCVIRDIWVNSQGIPEVTMLCVPMEYEQPGFTNKGGDNFTGVFYRNLLIGFQLTQPFPTHPNIIRWRALVVFLVDTEVRFASWGVLSGLTRYMFQDLWFYDPVNNIQNRAGALAVSPQPVPPPSPPLPHEEEGAGLTSMGWIIRQFGAAGGWQRTDPPPTINANSPAPSHGKFAIIRRSGDPTSPRQSPVYNLVHDICLGAFIDFNDKEFPQIDRKLFSYGRGSALPFPSAVNDPNVFDYMALFVALEMDGNLEFLPGVYHTDIYFVLDTYATVKSEFQWLAANFPS